MAAGEDAGLSPVTSRRRLCGELRRERFMRGVTQEEVARGLNWSPSKVIRIEGGVSNISVNHLNALLRFYAITDSDRVAQLVSLARRARQRAWWHEYKTVISPGTENLLGLEPDARVIRVYSQLIPALLQTPAYAREVLEFPTARMDGADSGTPEQRVEVLLHRQRGLFNRTTLPELVFVVDEVALNRCPLDPTVMVDQLGRLVTAAESFGITLHVLPLSADLRAGLISPFELLEFGNDDSVLVIENQFGLLYVETQAVIRQCRDAFDHLQGVALSPGASLDFIRARRVASSDFPQATCSTEVSQ